MRYSETIHLRLTILLTLIAFFFAFAGLPSIGIFFVVPAIAFCGLGIAHNTIEFHKLTQEEKTNG